jgi:hypothetical protein
MMDYLLVIPILFGACCVVIGCVARTVWRGLGR